MIFFDIDETLLDFKRAENLAVMKLFEVYEENFNFGRDEFYDKWCSIGKVHFNRYLTGQLTFSEQKIERVKEIFRTVDISLNDIQAENCFTVYLRSFEDSWKAFSDVIPCLESLKEYRLGIISNGDYHQQKTKLERIGILHYFEVIVTAGEVGVAKPHPQIFEIACDRAGMNPRECVYIGDDFNTDIEACEKAGMKGIWINRHPHNKNNDSMYITDLNQLKLNLPV